MTPEAGHHFVEYERDVMRRGHCAQFLQEFARL